MTNTTWESLAQEEQTGEYKSKPDAIPEGTRVLQTLEGINLQSFPGSDHESLNLKWRIEAPGEYKGRPYYQTIYINGSDPTGPYYDPAKQANTIAEERRKVFAIDFHCGKNIAGLGREPTEAEMQKYLIGAQIMAVLGVGKTGKQVVRSMHGIDPEFSIQASQAKPANKLGTKAAAPADYIDDDDIPF